jgi:nicotinic acid mononucleotide adenylyltransferase
MALIQAETILIELKLVYSEGQAPSIQLKILHCGANQLKIKSDKLKNIIEQKSQYFWSLLNREQFKSLIYFDYESQSRSQSQKKLNLAINELDLELVRLINLRDILDLSNLTYLNSEIERFNKNKNYEKMICELMGLFFEGFNLKFHQWAQNLLGNQYRDFLKIKSPVNRKLKCEIKSNKILLFPGSFNPWHQGHLECVKQGLTIGTVIVIPDLNPWKQNQSSPFGVLNEMKKSLGSLKTANPLYIFPGFLGLNDSQYTVDWLQSWVYWWGKNKNEDWGFLMGDDCFMALHQWKNHEDILKIVPSFYVVPRQFKEIQWNQQLKHLKKGTFQFLFKHQHQNISSTKLRKNY